MKSSQPKWLSLDTEEQDGQRSNEGGAGVTTVVHGIELNDSRRWCLWWFLKVITILLCFFQVVTALMGLTLIDSITEVGKVLTAIYMIFFAVVLGAFEAYQLKPVAFIKIDHMYRRNFGFIFNPLGKSLYIIFIAFLSFGLENPASLCFVNGLSLCLFGGAQLALYLQYPELFEQLSAITVQQAEADEESASFA